MVPLRKRMLEELQLHNLSKATVSAYLGGHAFSPDTGITTALCGAVDKYLAIWLNIN